MVKIIVVILLTLPSLSWGRARHELGVFGGPFLIALAPEVAQSVGGRVSIAVNSNHIHHLELRGFGSNFNGISYYVGEVSIRNEFKVDRVAAVWLLGLDYHYFRTPRSDQFNKRTSWHAGVGFNLEIGKNLMFRNDYITRFSNGIAYNGMSLIVTVGLAWAFGS